MKSDIKLFIKNFHGDSEYVFTNGCCYWFAFILYNRFIDLNPKIMYSQKDNHFGVLINDEIYDITGEITNSYDWVEWNSFSDTSEKDRIIRDCIRIKD